MSRSQRNASSEIVSRRPGGGCGMPGFYHLVKSNAIHRRYSRLPAPVSGTHSLAPPHEGPEAGRVLPFWVPSMAGRPTDIHCLGTGRGLELSLDARSEIGQRIGMGDSVSV